MLAILVALVFGYGLGSIPFGLVLTRAAGLGDIRSIGSGNIGATNVLRTGRKGLAAATLLADVFKGTVAILIARQFAGEGAAMAAGVGAFLGHLFPVWLGFKGGKGVATYIGCLLGLHWPAALAFCGVWLAMAGIFRISSLAALTASAVVPVAMWIGGWVSTTLAAVLIALAVLVWIRHKENIARLLAGTEPKIGKKKDAPAASDV
ncbi:glycerol-3-phosphate 1-O-acyltransferase PlsY [Pinisolibacter sp.]|uniref:glycerol-3-phosphate 1-O-acyltransferase PlsY n=1 Tax=Pinisolibacter sp. TaxID=2172024 RepID=UPI002FDCA010